MANSLDVSKEVSKHCATRLASSIVTRFMPRLRSHGVVGGGRIEVRGVVAAQHA